MLRSRSRLLAAAAVLSTLLGMTACGGDDAAESSVPEPDPTAGTSPDRTDPLFSESTSDPDGEPTIPSSATDGTEPTGDSVPTGSTTTTSAVDGTSPATTVGTGATGSVPSTSSSPTTVAGGPPTSASQSATTAAPNAGATGPNPFAGVEDVLPASAVDDTPFCEAYANVLNTFLGVSFAAAFPDSGPANSRRVAVPPETLELLAYPRLLDDVQIVADEGPSALSIFVEPLSARVSASPELLRSAGFGDDEISRLAAADRLSDIDVGGLFAEGIDPRLSSAASALIDGYGDFGEFSDVMGAPAAPEDEVELNAFFESECPLLSAASGTR